MASRGMAWGWAANVEKPEEAASVAPKPPPKPKPPAPEGTFSASPLWMACMTRKFPHWRCSSVPLMATFRSWRWGSISLDSIWILAPDCARISRIRTPPFPRIDPSCEDGTCTMMVLVGSRTGAGRVGMGAPRALASSWRASPRLSSWAPWAKSQPAPKRQVPEAKFRQGVILKRPGVRPPAPPPTRWPPAPPYTPPYTPPKPLPWRPGAGAERTCCCAVAASSDAHAWAATSRDWVWGSWPSWIASCDSPRGTGCGAAGPRGSRAG
mmetsp:Transcript_70180/g.158712  ORF Transcript_70180/g.158712 Transcript_70180/m.158712 type:complete len:267 (+) Transcript_70180:69-869(+)